jgi:WD40 repeat protein
MQTAVEPDPAATRPAVANPYVGPEPYALRDRRVFVGREQETAELLALLISEGVVLFHAISGAGKSSLVNARLIPRLEDRGYKVLPVARVGKKLSPDAGPLVSVNPFLASVLWHLSECEAPAPSTSDSGVCALRDPDLKSYLDRRREQDGADPKRRVLIVDQFEEILTTHAEFSSKREEFFEAIRAALESDPLFSVLFVAREEYAARLHRYREWLPCERLVGFHMEQLTRAVALDVVQLPARSAGCEIDKDAANLIVTDLSQINTDGFEAVASGEFVEPVTLQVVCYQLWHELTKRGGPPAQVDVGAVEEIFKETDGETPFSSRVLAAFYDDVVAQVATKSRVSEGLIRTWIAERLIAPNHVRMQVLRGAEKTGGLPNEAVDLLVQQHLLREEQARNASWCELVHDRFVAPILESNLTAIPSVVQEVLRDVEKWTLSNRDPRNLYYGDRLTRADRLRQRRPELASREDVRQFLSESALKERKRTTVLKFLTVAFLAAALLAGFFGLVSYSGAHTARARALSAASLTSIVDDPHRALLLAVQSGDAARQQLYERLWGTESTDHAANALNTALQHAREVRSFSPAGTTTQPAVPVLGASFMNELGLVAFDESGTISIMNWVTGERQQTIHAVPRTGAGTRGRPLAIAGNQLFWSGDTNTVQVWNATSGAPLAEIQPRVKGVQSLAVDPVARRLIVVGGGVELWNLDTWRPAREQLPANTSACAVAFSPGHDQFAIGTANGVELWKIKGDRLEAQMLAPRIAMSSTPLTCLLEFDPKGRYLIAGNTEGAATIWDIHTGRILQDLVADREGGIYAVAFSQDGSRFATAGADKIVRIWTIAPSGDNGPIVSEHVPSIELVGHTATVRSVSFAGPGDYLATSSMDGTVRVWDLGTRPRLLRVEEASLTTDGELLAVPTQVIGGYHGDCYGLLPKQVKEAETKGMHIDRTCVTIWSIPEAERLGDFPCLVCSGAVLSADHRRLAVWGRDGVRLWVIDSGTFLRRLVSADEPLESVGEIYAIALSGDGLRLAVLGTKDVTVWDTDRPARLFSWNLTADALREAEPRWRAVSLSPDGRWLALGGDRLLLVDLLAQPKPYSLDYAPIDFAWSQLHASDSKTSDTSREWLLAGITGKGQVGLWRVPKDARPEATKPEMMGESITTGINDARHLALTEDGRYVVVAGARGLRAWNVADHKENGTFEAITKNVHTFALGPPESTAAPGSKNYPVTTISNSGAIQQWTTDPHELLLRAYARATRTLTADECQIYLNETPCPPAVMGLDDVRRGVASSREAGSEAFAAAENYFRSAGRQGVLLPLPVSDMARRERAAVLEEAGFRLLRADREQEAIAQLQAAKEVRGGPLSLHTVRTLVATAERRAANKRVDGAIAAFEAARVLNADALRPSKGLALNLNNLCWFGTLAGQGKRVMSFCQQAVDMDQDNGMIRDSRGLARMCTGETAGAREDFHAFVAWTKNTLERDERQKWIAALDKPGGVNPCADGKLLDDLRQR